MAIITISRQMGSAGSTLGNELARRLGYAVIDKELILRVAKGLKVSAPAVERFDQEEFRRGLSVLERYLIATPSPFAAVAMGLIWPGPELEIPPAALAALNEQEYLAATQDLIRKLADQGGVVLMGRGAQVVLADHPQAFHLRTIAPLDERVARISRWLKLPEPEARALVERRDKACADYLRHFYKRDWDDPLLYHLTINTGRIETDEAAALITDQIKTRS